MVPRVKQPREVLLAIVCGMVSLCPRVMAQNEVPPTRVFDGKSAAHLSTTSAQAAPAASTFPMTSSSQMVVLPWSGGDDVERAVPSTRSLTLASAIAQALKTQPALWQARAQTHAAEGRTDQARSGYLPQVTGAAAYQRTTGNFATRPGAFPANAAVKTSYRLGTTYDFFNFSLTASQLIYDFGQTSGRWSAAESAVDASLATEDAMRFQTVMNVQGAFYQAWAQRALVSVAQETLDNQRRHLEQIEAAVKVGVRPDIDLAQARANVANARVQVINTQNAYEVAKDQLNAAMGMMTPTDFDVADEEAPPIGAEDGPIEPLVNQALAARPDVVALQRQHDAQSKTIRSFRGGYGPSLVASTAGTEQGTQLNNMVPNWNVGVTLTWPIFQGGMTNGQIREAQANLENIDAQLASLRLQIRTQVDQARLAVRAAKASIGAAVEALTNAQLQLKLAEGRYAAGVGSIIELADAQVAYTNARAQVVQAHFNLSNSRAQLVTALGLR
jgi:outer membrane protein